MSRVAREAVAFAVIIVMLAGGSVGALALAEHAPQAIPWGLLVFVPLFCALTEMLCSWVFAHPDHQAMAPHAIPGRQQAAGHVLSPAVKVRAGERLRHVAADGPTLATCERYGVCTCGAVGPAYGGEYDILTAAPQPHIIAWHDQHTAAHRTGANQ